MVLAKKINVVLDICTEIVGQMGYFCLRGYDYFLNSSRG